MSAPQPAPRAPAVPPTPQEIQRKLGSPTLPSSSGPALSSSIESISMMGHGGGLGQGLSSSDLQRRLSSTSRRAHGSMSSVSGDEGDEGSSPPMRPTAHLSAISEAEDALASGSESDASSFNGGGLSRQGSRSAAYAQHDHPASRTSRDSGGLSENVALKSGYLMKKGEKRKTWKKRWFVLRGGQLAMYKTDKEYRLLRLIPLPEIHSATPVELKKHSHAFGIVTPKRTYYVEASSPDEVQSWCRLIERARTDYRSRATVTSMDSPRTSGVNTEQPTPVGPSPAQTPRALSYEGVPVSPTSAAIPIPSASLQQQQQPPPSGGGVYSTSPSAFAPSSYQSTSSGGGASSYSHHPHPPSSSVSPSGGLNLSSTSPSHYSSSDPASASALDSGFSALSLAESSSRTGPTAGAAAGAAVPQRSFSGVSDTLSIPPGGVYGSSLGVPLASPGLASSSEDEDGFETYEQQQQQQGQRQYGAVQGQYEQQQQQAVVQSFAQQQQQPQHQQQQQPVQQQGQGFAPVDPNKVILAGYLMKQGKRRTWRKRWFVLQSGTLMYSRSHMDTKFSRRIPLSSILDALELDSPPPASQSSKRLPLSPSSPPTSSSFAPSSSSSPTSPHSHPHSHSHHSEKNYEHCFKIITPKRTFLCCAPSEEDEIKWLAALQCLVARRNQSTLSPPPPSVLPPHIQYPLLVSPPAQPAEGADTLTPLPAPSATPAQRRPSQTGGSRPLHGRQRSVTDAARQAVREVERRFHPMAVAGEREREREAGREVA